MSRSNRDSSNNHSQQYRVLYDSSQNDRGNDRRNDYRDDRDRHRRDGRRDERSDYRREDRREDRRDDRRDDKYRRDDRSYERRKSRSRTPPRKRSPSPQLLDAILEGHISENLEVNNKAYKYVVDDFKVKLETNIDPLNFSPQPILAWPIDEDMDNIIEESRKLRSLATQIDHNLSDAKLKVFQAELKVKECDDVLRLIREQMNNYEI